MNKLMSTRNPFTSTTIDTRIDENSFDDVINLFFKDVLNSTSWFSDLPSLKKVNYPVDVKSYEDRVEIDVAAVGINREDIKIDVNDNTLTISYKKKETNKEKGGHYVWEGITKKSFSHAWKILDNYDVTKVDAKLDKGLLTVTIPKIEKPKLKNIEVKIK